MAVFALDKYNTACACAREKCSDDCSFYRDYKQKLKPATNYDRIRAKSVEEMAEWLDRLIEHCNDGPCFNCFMQKACLTSMLDWLKQEAEE